jgi:hypothetical protein
MGLGLVSPIPSQFTSKVVVLLAMKEASSLASFRSTRLETFRKNLQAALQQVLIDASSSSSSFVSSYNPSILEKSLHESIAWRELCEHHDDYHYNKKSIERCTPLFEICDLFLVDIPRACTVATVKPLLNALLQSTHQPSRVWKNNAPTRWSPSQELVLKTIVSLLNLCPSLPLRHLFSDIGDSNYSPTQLNNLVSVTYTLAQDCPRFRSDLIQTMLQLIRIQDDKLIIAKPKKETCSDMCEFCGQHRQQVLRPNKRVRYNLSDLHDGDHTHSDYIAPKKSYARQPPVKVSLKKVLKKDNTKPTECTCSTPSSSNDQKLVTVQSRAYNKLVRLATSHHYPLRVLIPSIGNKQNKKSCTPSWRIRDWMRLIFYHPTSPSLRLGLLFTATSNQPQEIATVYWQNYLSTTNTLWLRFLSELIASSRYFDHPEKCWIAVSPLWHHLLSSTTEDGCPGLFAALAHLLSSRGPLLKYEHEAEFSQLLTTTCVNYGHGIYWKMALPQFAITLQEYDILGLVELSAWEEAEDSASHSLDKDRTQQDASSKALHSWPFEEAYTLSGAYLRLANATTTATTTTTTTTTTSALPNKKDDSFPEEFRDCMSSPTHYQDLVAAASAREASTITKKESPPKSVPPLLDYLNADIQQNVMGHLNHVELLRARGVCQDWKSLIDDGKLSLWHHAYSHYFGPYKTEAPVGDRDWMSLFHVKYLNEVNLNFQRNAKTAYKHRTCSYLGCMHVVKSDKQRAQHEERHVREQTRQNKRQLREEERQQREEEKLFVEYLKQEAKREEQKSK